jgi:hypothetical protein
MKNVFILALLLCSAVSFAQTYNEEIDMLQAMYGQEKKQIVADFIKLDGDAKTNFWMLYDQYEAERKALGIQRINLIGVYAEYYHNVDDGGLDVLAKEMLRLAKSNDDLIAKYYNKIKKKAGVRPATQFIQIEHYLLSNIRATILEEIPFIGQLD